MSVACCYARLQGACTSTATVVCRGRTDVLACLLGSMWSACWCMWKDRAWAGGLCRGGGSLLVGVTRARRSAAGEPDRQRLGRVQRVADRAQAAAQGAANAALMPRPRGGLERAPACSPCCCCWQVDRWLLVRQVS